MEIDEVFKPLLGETAWHSVILDPRIAEESERHYQLVRAVINQFGTIPDRALHILEVASYAHTTGYRLVRDLGARVTLFEISRHSLRRGRELGGVTTGKVPPCLVAGDFHALPFEDGSFDLVYICSALHHTWDYPRVLRELIRVTAPSGLLFLENEPTERGLCFHQFRCNRPDAFTPFERRLGQLDLLRTVAEPYVGSRPEALFGMVENQTISLTSLFEILEENCELQMLELTPEQCMGARERRWLQWRGQEPETVAQQWRTDVEAACRDAGQLHAAVDQGLGFNLPAPEAIAALAALAGPALAGLPRDPGLAEYRYGLARLFGAPVRLVARKQAGADMNRAEQAAGLLSKAERFCGRPQTDGIIEAYPEPVRELLGTPSLWPEIQTGDENRCREAFSSEAWQYSRGPEGLVSLVSRGRESAIGLPADAEAGALMLLRIYCLLEPEAYYRIEVKCGRTPVFVHEAYLQETVLAAVRVTSEMLSECGGGLTIQLDPLPAAKIAADPKVAVSYAGWFPLAARG